MEEKISDIKPQEKKSGKKFWIGLGVFLAVAFLVWIAQNQVFEISKERNLPETEGQQGARPAEGEESEAVRGQDVEIFLEEASLPQPSTGPQTGGAGAGPQPSQPAQKPLVCRQAEEALATAKAKAESGYKIAAAEAESIYQLEMQEANAELARLTKLRAAAINAYDTAISQATIKYNNSTEPEAYTVYKQESVEALATYNETVAEIEQEEQIWKDQSEDAKLRRDIRTREAEAARAEAVEKAEAEYELGTTGQGCN